MTVVLQLSKWLHESPQALFFKGLTIKTYAQADDIASWLDLRDAAFAHERTGIRRWSQDDFVTEFLHRWWWRPQWMWLAEAESTPAGTEKRLVGSVTLAMRGDPDQARPVVHWLMVHPRWRRRGVGRLLMSHLEAAAWDAGYREIHLETHAAWEAAVRFYEAMGYRAAAR